MEHSDLDSLATGRHGEAAFPGEPAGEPEFHQASSALGAGGTISGASAMLMRGSPLTPLRDLTMTLLDRLGLSATVLVDNLSQLHLNYRGTAAVMGRAGALAGGDRAPNQRFFDGLAQADATFWDLLAPDRLTLVLLDSGVADARHQLVQVKHQALASFGHILDVSIVTADPLAHARPYTDRLWLDRSRDLERYHQPGRVAAYVVRPDQHIAAAQAALDWPQLAAFLRRDFLGQQELAPQQLSARAEELGVVR